MEDTHWLEADRAAFTAAWTAELAEVPEFSEATLHIVAGLLLPIWKQLPRTKPASTGCRPMTATHHRSPGLARLGRDHAGRRRAEAHGSAGPCPRSGGQDRGAAGRRDGTAPLPRHGGEPDRALRVHGSGEGPAQGRWLLLGDHQLEAAHRAAELSQRLAQNVQAVCRHYLPAGQARRPLLDGWRCRPERLGAASTSVCSRPNAAAIGNWVDAATGEHGDLVDLIRLNQRHGRLAETINEAERFLSLPPSALGRTTPLPQSSPNLHEQGLPIAAKRLFAASKPLSGSLAANLPALTRHHAGIPTCQPCGSIHAATTGPMRMMSRELPEHFPALIAAVTDNDGVQTGTHRTWLDPTGGKKAKVASPRRAMGNILGNAVRFGTSG
jgi:hypothetical protein